MRVLIVEDDDLLGAGLQVGLRQEGCVAEWVQDAETAAHALRSAHFDAAILDLGLPGRDGLSLLRELRSEGQHTPVLILTARDAVQDRVAGLDAGADDYMVKPFDLPELAARLRALLRRTHGQGDPKLEDDDVVVDTVQRSATLAGRPLSLSRKEYDVLEVLVGSVDQVVPRARLQSLVYGWGEETESNALEVHVHNLRRKLGSGRILTIRGVGYQLVSKPPR